MRFASQARRLAEEAAAQAGVTDGRVIDALASIPRHLFVDEALQMRAYTDDALPIGHAQTISKPSTVARMTALLDPQPDQRILEIGTGSGYQAAVLAALGCEVYSVERIAPLALRARRLLNQLQAFRVHVRTGDGSVGWPEAAPFARIIVTAAAPRLTERLRAQLAVGGRLISPVETGERQVLRLITRSDEGWQQEDLDAVRFVPLVEGGRTGNGRAGGAR